MNTTALFRKSKLKRIWLQSNVGSIIGRVEIRQQEKMDILCIDLAKSYVSCSLISKQALQLDPFSVGH